MDVNYKIMNITSLNNFMLQNNISIPIHGSGIYRRVLRKDLISAIDKKLKKIPNNGKKKTRSPRRSPRPKSLPRESSNIKVTHPDVVTSNKNNNVYQTYGPIIKKLGEGSYGVVTLHKTKGKSYAIKKMTFVDYNISESSIVELAIIQRMNHPNILSLVDYKISKDLKYLYIVTYFMKNGELKKYIPLLNPNSQSIAKKLVYQLLCGVAYMNSLDIIHRDLKPQNLLLDSNYDLKIADFGTSKALSCVNPANKTVEVVSLNYRPPELFYGGRGEQYGSSLDMWSVGCIIFEIVTGKILFKGSSEENMRKLIAYRLGDPTEAIWPGVSKFPYYNLKEITGKQPNNEITKKYIKDKIIKQKDVEAWFEIIMSLIIYDPNKRATALQTLKKPYFDTVRDKKLEATHHSCLDNLYLVEKPINFTINKQVDISYNMKYMIIDWLLGVNLRYRLKLRTYYIAIYLHDSLNMSNFFIYKKDYQLYSISCMYIAAVYNEIDVSSASDFADITADAYTSKQVLDMSTKILKHIDFKMVFSTCYDFIVEYGIFYDTKVQKLSKGLLYFISLLPDKLYQTKPDQVALMAIMMACMYYGKKFKHISRVTNKLIKNISFCINFKTNELPFAKKLFRSDKYKYTLDGSDIDEVIKELCSKKLII